MASIIEYGGGWRVHVCVRGVRDSRVFPSKREAKAWGEMREKELARTPAQITFGEAAERWMKRRRDATPSARFADDIERRLELYVLPKLGALQISEIHRPALVEVVEKVEEAGRLDTARKVCHYISAIMDMCVDRGEIESHPGARLSRVLSRKPHKPMRAVKAEEVGKLLLDIETISARVIQLAMLMAAHTALRSRELRTGQWSDIVMDDPAGPVWIVSAEAMKMGRLHVVPLSRQVVGMLTELKEIAGASPWIFPSPHGEGEDHVDGSTLMYVLYRLGYHGRMTLHGWRSIFSTHANESGWHSDAIERQLAHRGKDLVREAYHRSEYLDERRKMMQAHSDWLDAQRAAARKPIASSPTS